MNVLPVPLQLTVQGKMLRNTSFLHTQRFEMLGEGFLLYFFSSWFFFFIIIIFFPCSPHGIYNIGNPGIPLL